VYVLVVAQSSSEVPEGLMNNPVVATIKVPTLVQPRWVVTPGKQQIA